MASITMALAFLATSVLLSATVARSTDPQQELQHNATSQPEQWTPVPPQAALVSKQDGGEQYLDPSQQILLIAPDHVSVTSPGGERSAQRVPARGEVINTNPQLQQAGSGVVLQIHPQYLKGYPTNQIPQTLKHIQGSSLGHGYNRNANVPAPQLALHVQPQFVLTGVHNPALLPKQVQPPLYYNNQGLAYQNQLKPVQLTPPSPTVLAQLAAAQYPQLFQANQHVKVAGHPSGVRGAQLNALVQHPVLKPAEEAIFGQTKQSPAEKLRTHVRDTSNDEAFPDFGKMFESYFKSGPFGESFRNDNPENVETNLKINTNDDFPTGDFFGNLDKSKAASSNQQQTQQGDGQFQPCDFFKAANQKVVEGDDGGSSGQFSTEKRAAREPNHFGQTRGRDDEDRTRGERDGYKGHREDDEEDESPRHRPSQTQQRPNSYRHKESDDDDDDDEDKRPANFHHHHNHDGYSRKPSSQNQHGGGNYGRPPQEQNGGGSYSRPSQENNSGRNYGSPSEEHKSLGSYGQQSQEQKSGVNYGKPSQGHNNGDNYGRPFQGQNNGGNYGKSSQGKNNNGGNYERPSQGYKNNGGNYGRPSQGHNNGGHSARPSNQRPSSERHEESRPSYRHNNNDDDDDDDDEDDRPQRPGHDERRARPGNSYKPGQGASPAIRTFHSYNFPPAPDYSREASNRDIPREAGAHSKRPPPVREAQDTLAYYTYVAPAGGNTDVYYLSEKQLIARNSSTTK